MNDVTRLVVAWRLAPFVVGNGDICNELVEVVLGKVVSISVRFFPIINEFGKTCALGSLGKYLEVELEMVDKDLAVGCDLHIGEFILVIGDVCAVCLDAFSLLWYNFTLEEACICVLGPSFDRFSVDKLDDVVGCHVLEGFVVAHGSH